MTAPTPRKAATINPEALAAASAIQSYIGGPLAGQLGELERENMARIIDKHRALAVHADAAMDTKRLDWLEQHARWSDPDNLMRVTFPMETKMFTSVRATIDVAMSTPPSAAGTRKEMTEENK